MLVRLIAWPIWMILLLSYLAYIPILRTISEKSGHISDIHILENLEPTYQTFLIATLILVAIIEAIITVLLRKYLLQKAMANKIFDIKTTKGKFRFLVVHIINWIIACFIAGGGLVFALTTNRIEWSYGFFALFAATMLFHIPRLTPYQQGLTSGDSGPR